MLNHFYQKYTFTHLQTYRPTGPQNYLNTHTHTHTHTHTVVTVMIDVPWDFEGKQINAVRMRRRSKITSHGHWQCHYDHPCQGHDPNMLDQSLQSITPSPDCKLEHVIRTSWVITFIQNPYQNFRLSNYLLKFREVKNSNRPITSPNPQIHSS